MDHDWAVGLVVGTDVFELEAFGQDVIELDGSELPLSAEAVAHEEVGLWAVEGGFADGFFVREGHFVEDSADVGLGAFPGGVVGGLEFFVGGIAFGESDAVVA